MCVCLLHFRHSWDLFFFCVFFDVSRTVSEPSLATVSGHIISGDIFTITCSAICSSNAHLFTLTVWLAATQKFVFLFKSKVHPSFLHSTHTLIPPTQLCHHHHNHRHHRRNHHHHQQQEQHHHHRRHHRRRRHHHHHHSHHRYPCAWLDPHRFSCDGIPVDIVVFCEIIFALDLKLFNYMHECFIINYY